MMKKAFLFFICAFVVIPAFADTNRVFIEPKVAEILIKKYFGNMVSEKMVPEIMSVTNVKDFANNKELRVTDEMVLARVLATWSDCIKSDPDKFISTNCVVEVCKSAFGASKYQEIEYRSFGNHANNYCKRFAKDLVNTSAFVQNPDCLYVVSKKDGSQTKIQYKTYDDTGFVRDGGSIAWRFFNPGNLRRSSLACTRISTKPNGTFAVFENYEQGKEALSRLLRSSDYSGLTIEQAISKYAPAHENDTERYIQTVKNGLVTSRSDVDTLTLGDLSDKELDVLMKVIQQIEGWHVSGEVVYF